MIFNGKECTFFFSKCSVFMDNIQHVICHERISNFLLYSYLHVVCRSCLMSQLLCKYLRTCSNFMFFQNRALFQVSLGCFLGSKVKSRTSSLDCWKRNGLQLSDYKKRFLHKFSNWNPVSRAVDEDIFRYVLKPIVQFVLIYRFGC